MQCTVQVELEGDAAEGKTLADPYAVEPVEAELKKLIDGGHVEKLPEIGVDTFASPVVFTKKSD